MTPLDERSKALRRQIVRTLAASGHGHLASAFSLVEILRVLFDDVLKYDAKNPKWEARDRFILSKGHGCLALYTLLAEKGFIPESELWKFCRADGLLGGHPSHHIPGVECSTGSLGHGLPIGVGMALANRDRRVFVVMGDGECQEGSVFEAAIMAVQQQLTNIVVIVDHNKMQSYGPLLEPFDNWFSTGWLGCATDGHNTENLRWAFKFATNKEIGDRPYIIRCDTVKGKGVSFVENNLNWHHKNGLSPEELAALLAELE